jgi:DNA replication protein DnaC
MHLSKRAIGGAFRPNEQQRNLMNQLYNHRYGKGNLHKDKGVLLYGSYGTGKTEILRAFCRTNFNPYNPNRNANPTRLTTAIQMVQHYDDAGNFLRYLDKDLYIDDLGTEQRAKYKAKDEDHVLGKFLESWSQQNEFKLYATTNLTLDEIGERYGGRVFSRLHLMCNVIEFNGEDWRLKK